MEDKIIEVFKKYSKSVDTEYNVYNCLIEEDWPNIAQEAVKLFRQSAVSGSLGFDKGYEQGYNDATREACQEIAKNYQPNDR